MAQKKDEGYYGLGWGPVGWKAIEAMHEMIAAAARVGQNMVVDHLMFIDPPILQDCIWRMADVPVLFVNLKPSRQVLEKRVTERKIELPPPMVEAVGGPDGVKKLGETLRAMTPWYYERAYQNDCADLELDSDALDARGALRADRGAPRARSGNGIRRIAQEISAVVTALHRPR